MDAVRKAGKLLVVGVLFFVVLSGTGMAQSAPSPAGGTSTTPDSERVVGGPDIELSAQNNRLAPGTTQTVTFQMSNSGNIFFGGSEDLEQRVKTARNLRAEVAERRLPSGIELRSGPVLVGSVPEGSGQPVTFTFEVSEDLDPGLYKIPVELSYDFTRVAERFPSGDRRFRDFSRTRTERVSFVVEDDAIFTASTVNSNIVAGDTGELEVEIENEGTRTAYTPRITFSSGESGVFFGGLEGGEGGATKTVGTETLPPGYSKRVTVTTSASDELAAGMYPVNVDVVYETEGGVQKASRTMTVLLETLDEQSFDVTNLESTLRVGEEGDLTGEVTNEGPKDVQNAVVVFSPESRNVNPRDNEYPVGSLASGESAEFNYRVSVSSEADSGPKQSSVEVRYRNPDGDRRVSDSIDVVYDVGDERDEFSLDANLSVAAGSSTSAEIEITNVDNQTLTDIEAKMFTNDPLSSGDDEAFISELRPGDSETIVFDLSAGGGATGKTYPATIDFRYDDESGDTKISDSYRVPVTVRTAGSEGSSSGLLVLVVVAVLAAAGWFSRDRLREIVESDTEEE